MQSLGKKEPFFWAEKMYLQDPDELAEEAALMSEETHTETNK